ncbi:hypothetical protein Ctob_016134, partial [Chrysochromulina tobinii]
QGPFQSPHALKTHQAQWCKECSDDAAGQDAAEQDTSRLSSSQANTALKLDAQGIMMDTFTKLRTYHNATDGAIAEIKTMLAELHKLTECHLERAQPDDLFSAITPVQEALDDIRSKYLEDKQRERDQPSLRPQKRVLGTRRQVIDDHSSREFEDVVYDMPLKETLERVLKHNALVLTDIMKASELWEAAAAVAPANVVFSDFYHGHAFKTHRGFSSAAPDTAALCVAVILSVRPEHRLSLHNIHLATIAMENHIAWYGAERVVSGGDDNGSWENSTSFAAQMRRLYASLSSIAAVPEVMLPS